MRYFNNNTIQNCRIGKWRIMNRKGGGDSVGRSRGGVYGKEEEKNANR